MGTPLRGREAEAQRNDVAILDAARRLFASGGGASVADIAAAAGVGVASLYRRFESKQALLQHLCLISLQRQIETAEEALQSQPAWEGFAHFVDDCVSDRVGIFASLAGTIEVTTPLRTAARSAHDRLARLVKRTQDEGSLRPDVSARDVQDLLELFSRRLLNDGYQRALALALDGLRDRGHGTLPGTPPRWQDGERRWLAR